MKHNPYWLTNGPWYNTSICTKLHRTVFEKYITNARSDIYNIICYIDAHEKNSHHILITVSVVVVVIQ